jgi:prepilin-type N-terminal cleavage/methylation domain-containing protein
MIKLGGQTGFTLIETVMAIVVAGLLGLMIFMFARAGLESAPTPWLRIVNMADLRQVMEDINEDYFRYQNAAPWQADTAYAEGDRIRSTDNMYGYECVIAGTSGATEPVWPQPTTDTVDDNGVGWQYFLVTMQGKVNSKEYGRIQYDVIDNLFVREDPPGSGQFSSTGATPDDYLKVTLGKVSGAPGETAPQKVMTLFCKIYTL